MKQHLNILFVFLIYSIALNAQDSTLYYLTVKGIDTATKLHYEEAAEIFDEIIQLQPDNPQGYFLKSAVYFWKFSEDPKNTIIGDKFRDLSFQAVEVAQARLDDDSQDIDAMFYLGGAYGSLGRYYVMTRSFLNAYWYGKKGVNYMEDVVAIDSTYYDAYLGLGIYHYLSDILPRFIKILSFLLGLEGDREQGIKELNLAATKGRFTKTEAIFFLGAIYTYREREYEKALTIFSEFLEKYPQNPGALIHLGRCYSQMGKCDLAMEAFNKILNNKTSQSLLPRGSIYYQLGDIYYKMNDFEQAKENYLLAIASDTAEVGKRRWIYPRSHYKVAQCYEILGDIGKAQYHYNEIKEEDSERAYELVEEREGELLKDIDILLIKAKNLKGCHQYEQASVILNSIESKYAGSVDEYIQKNLREVNFRSAEIVYEQKFYDKAINRFEKIVLEDKEDRVEYWSYYYLGNIYKSKGYYEKAREAYDKAEDTDDNWLLENIEDERQELVGN